MQNQRNRKRLATAAMLLTLALVLTGCTTAANTGEQPAATAGQTGATINDGSAESQPQTTGVYTLITAEKAKEMLDSNQKVTLLDVRELTEYASGHIKGAKLLSLGDIPDKAATALPDKNATILVYCRSGSRSRAAANELISQGYTNVLDMGGIMERVFNFSAGPAAIDPGVLQKAASELVCYGDKGMLRLAKAVLPLYPSLNADLVLSGVMIHDLCKVEEMDSDSLGVVRDYTENGLLLGHIVMGVARIGEVAAAQGVTGEPVTLLQHMMLSHHGEENYGSPRKPMFPEAELLHWIDLLDARMNEMQTALDKLPEGVFSEKIWSLERRLYHPQYAALSPAVDAETAK